MTQQKSLLDAYGEATKLLITLRKERDELKAQRLDHDVLVSIAQLLTELLTETKHLRAALGVSARSSVELAENAKGAVQITVKAYDGSSLEEAMQDAVAGFRTLKQEVERGQMEQWRDSLEALQRDGAK